jgi:hypothetical protein
MGVFGRCKFSVVTLLGVSTWAMLPGSAAAQDAGVQNVAEPLAGGEIIVTAQKGNTFNYPLASFNRPRTIGAFAELKF